MTATRLRPFGILMVRNPCIQMQAPCLPLLGVHCQIGIVQRHGMCTLQAISLRLSLRTNFCRWCFPRSTPGHAGDTEDAGSVRSAVRRLALDSPGDMAPGEPQGDATAAGAFPPAAASELVDATDATSRANARKAVLAAIAIRKMASTTPQASNDELDFVHKMGPLIKRGHRRHNWLQRYFVLRENKVQSRCGASSLRVCVLTEMVPTCSVVSSRISRSGSGY